MKQEIKVPAVGESITEGILVEWHVADGDVVELDQPLFELETDKITMSVTAEAAGRVSIQVQEDSTVEIGQAVGTIDTDVTVPAGGGDGKGDVEAAAEPSEAEPEPAPVNEPEPEKPATEVPGNGGASVDLDGLSPAVRRLVAENDLDPSKIPATGREGRLLKEDVLHFLEGRADAKAAPTAPPVAPVAQEPKTPAPEAPAKPAKAPAPPTPKPAPQAPREPGERQIRKPMSQIRRRIAERLVQAQHQAAMLTTFNEVDMTNLMDMRARYKEKYKEKYGIGLGIMSFFVKASVDALKMMPAVNSMIDGTDLIENHYYDIGIAVSTERGLMVPVIRDVDKKSFAEIEIEIADFAARARDGKIKLDELQGGTFTITNGGVFGSLLSTPILNTPQSAILGMHGIKKRPVVIEKDGQDTIEIRPMMYLAMSYDHRVVDGRESVTFLKRIVECIENPERIMFEI